MSIDSVRIEEAAYIVLKFLEDYKNIFPRSFDELRKEILALPRSIQKEEQKLQKPLIRILNENVSASKYCHDYRRRARFVSHFGDSNSKITDILSAIHDYLNHDVIEMEHDCKNDQSINMNMNSISHLSSSLISHSSVPLDSPRKRRKLPPKKRLGEQLSVNILSSTPSPPLHGLLPFTGELDAVIDDLDLDNDSFLTSLLNDSSLHQRLADTINKGIGSNGLRSLRPISTSPAQYPSLSPARHPPGSPARHLSTSPVRQVGFSPGSTRTRHNSVYSHQNSRPQINSQASTVAMVPSNPISNDHILANVDIDAFVSQLHDHE